MCVDGGVEAVVVRLNCLYALVRDLFFAVMGVIMRARLRGRVPAAGRRSRRVSRGRMSCLPPGRAGEAGSRSHLGGDDLHVNAVVIVLARPSPVHSRPRFAMSPSVSSSDYRLNRRVRRATTAVVRAHPARTSSAEMPDAGEPGAVAVADNAVEGVPENPRGTAEGRPALALLLAQHTPGFLVLAVLPVVGGQLLVRLGCVTVRASTQPVQALPDGDRPR